MSTLQPPRRIDLPCFVYGVFKPGELAFPRLEQFHCAPPEATSLRGTLWLRDGLPLLEAGAEGEVAGYLLCFRSERAGTAYKVICEQEPAEHYRWQEIRLPEQCVNVLVGCDPQERSVKSDSGAWNSKDDPVFTWGVETVKAVAQCHAKKPFESAPAESFDWSRFFRLQMAYLLVWSAIERYTALRFGAGKKPEIRLSKLGKDPLFDKAFRGVVRRSREVADSRDPRQVTRLDPNKPAQGIKYYHQVRNNLSHRGKGAWKDGETVRQSLVELLQVFQAVLDESVFLAGREG